MPSLYKQITNIDEPITFDDIMASNMSGAEKKQAINERINAYNKALDRQKWKDIGRGAFGSVVSGASFLPIFNIPYVGTGIGGAMYDLGQGITEGDKANDLGKRTARGFAIGETVGAIPYVGKGANKLSGGKLGNAIMNSKPAELINKAGEKFANTKLYDALMTDVKAFNPNKQTMYHGSPYDFEKFSNEAIGKGEGFQAHGYGHYTAKSKDVADKNYRERLAQDYYLNGKKLNETSKEYGMIDTFNDYRTSQNPTLEDAKAAYIAQQEKFLNRYNTPNTDQMRKATQEYIDLAKSIDLNNLEVKSGGQLYKLSVPKDDVMLREGASFENQPKLVQKGLNNIKKDYLKSKGYNSIDDINAELDSLSNQYENIVKNESPYNFYAGNEKSEIQAKISQLENLRRFNETPDLYNYLLNHQHLEPHEVSDLLYKQGIKGISYNGGIDGEARVIFNPDDIVIGRKYYNQPGLYDKLTGATNTGATSDSLFDYLKNDSVLTKGYRTNKQNIDNAILNTKRKIDAGINPFTKGKPQTLFDMLADNSNDNVLDLTGIFNHKPTKAEITNYIQDLVNEGAMPTKSKDYLIDVPNTRTHTKHIQYPNGYNEMSRVEKKQHNALAMKLKEIIKNSEHSGHSPNSKNKPNVDSYHYFTVYVNDGENIFPVVLDTEQFIGESVEKPQTVHLYNFKRKK